MSDALGGAAHLESLKKMLGASAGVVELGLTALADRLPDKAADALSRSGVPSTVASLGLVPSDLALPATAAAAALLGLALLLGGLCCCCCSRRGDGREPLLPKTLPRSDRVCRAANNCGLGDAVPSISSGGGGGGALIGGSKFDPANGCCAAAAPVVMPNSGLFADPPFATGGCLGNVGGIIANISGSVETAMRQEVPRTQHEEAKTVTVVVADQEGGRGGGWGDLDSFDESITVKRVEHPTSRRGQSLKDFYDNEAVSAHVHTRMHTYTCTCARTLHALAHAAAPEGVAAPCALHARARASSLARAAPLRSRQSRQLLEKLTAEALHAPRVRVCVCAPLCARPSAASRKRRPTAGRAPAAVRARAAGRRKTDAAGPTGGPTGGPTAVGGRRRADVPAVADEGRGRW